MLFKFGSTKPKVLIIDDDASLQRQVQYRFDKRDQFAVYQASDGESGLKLINKVHPDLVILDWMLPGIDGPEILRQLKAASKTAGIPVLMLTGRDKIGDIEDAFALGAVDYLTKPFALQALSKKAHKALSLVK
ncbi:MAG: response regulator [Immundisolibacteraceae bacterium]|nr:response regulator [Immundisolibacteraceae bacterium]